MAAVARPLPHTGRPVSIPVMTARRHRVATRRGGRGDGTPSAVGGRRGPSARVRRRRALVGAVLLLAPPVGLLGGGPLASEGLAPAAAADRGGGRVYIVRPGDTLWSIAERLSPGSDPRPLVDDLTASLRGDQLQVGERLVVH